MGIKNLKYLINKYANEAINEKYLNFYENKIIAIDISIYLYRFIYKNGEPLELLVQQCMRLLKNKIIPLYVFDGKPPKEKNDVLDERNEKKVDLFNKQLQIKNLLERKKDLNEDNEICNNDEKINNIDDIFYNELIKMSNDELNMELQKIEKRIIIVNGTIIKKCKLLFQLMGIPYIVANGEAESLCAKLIKKNIVYGCLSEDTDILANGGRYFIRNFNVYNNKIIEYDLEKILEKFNMTYLEFIDMCILCGCDYTSTIKNIGVEKSYKFIKEYKTIEGVIDYINIENDKNVRKNKVPRYIVPANFDYITARELFLNCGENEDYNELKKLIKLDKPKLDELIEYIKLIIKPHILNDVKKNLLKYYFTLTDNDLTIDNFF